MIVADASELVPSVLGRTSAQQPLEEQIWELRKNLTAYGAAYVALAEIIDCPLVTADARLSRAPGLRCAVTVVPG